MQQMWRDTLGVDIELRQLEMQVYLTEQDQLHYDLSRSSWIGDYNDANTFLNMFVTDDGNNRTGWEQQALRRTHSPGQRNHRRADAREIVSGSGDYSREGRAAHHSTIFYAGINYFDTNKIEGVYTNIVDLHPLQSIRKIMGHATRNTKD